MRDSQMGNRSNARSGRRETCITAGQQGSMHSHRNRAGNQRYTGAGKGDLMNIYCPFHFDGRGRTASATDDKHIRDLIEQVLFTSPGERVNRPTFGSGLLELVFAPNSDVLIAAIQLTVQGALQQWLGDLILVEDVQVTGEDNTVNVKVQYKIRSKQKSQIEEFRRVI
ncbi:MAG TPA: GPW/gp25 family protein [Oculatellaceae cyanobacterium]